MPVQPNLSHILKRPNEYNEEHLVQMLREGRNAAFVHLYDNYSNALLKVIYTVVPDKDLAEGLLQDVFVNIFAKIGTFDGGRYRLYTWMRAIARNRSVDFVKSRAYRDRQRNGGRMPDDDRGAQHGRPVGHGGAATDARAPAAQVLGSHKPQVLPWVF